MAIRCCLSEYLQQLDFLGARPSSEYVGTKVDNPAMILEEHVPTWTRLTSLEDLQECFRVFEERVCVADFPARYSPQFWLAHAALTTIYSVMSGYLESHTDDDLKKETDGLLYDLWVRLIASGPGSSHLEMMSVILKHPHYPLWKYMQTLHGETLHALVAALKTDFVYKEDVSAEHYATLMETHIDKIFKIILSRGQLEEARQGLLDLYVFYLTRMNHVPPHIGPRLSHLCFLICHRFEKENPYMGRDDWVLMRHHLKFIKDIIIHSTFTVASEAQYRVPITLEKIFQAAIMDKMLNIMFKDFMTLLLTICNHDNSRKCKRLFLAFQTGLLEQLDFKRGFEENPSWLFDQCIDTLMKLSKTVKMETHIDEFIIMAQNLCLLKFTHISTAQVKAWHDLLVAYIVSGRTLLAREAGKLLSSSILKENNVLNWKTHSDQGILLIDIVTDMPAAFIQEGTDGSKVETMTAYITFLQLLLTQMVELNMEGRVRQSVHKCLLRCMEKDPHVKVCLSQVCLDSNIPDLTDVNFIRDVLFSIDALLREETCLGYSEALTNVLTCLLQACLCYFRSKGYVAVDLNSLVMSICLSCLSADTSTQDATDHVTMSCDLWDSIYSKVVVDFVELHLSKGTIKSISPLVPQVILAIKESIQKQGTTPERCVNFLCMLGTKCLPLITDNVKKLLELFTDWQCCSVCALLLVVYREEPGPFLAIFQEIFNKTMSMNHEEKHQGMIIVAEIAKQHTGLFYAVHICQLLGTYPTETDQTKELILQIVHSVVRVSPNLVSGYFTVLVDDSKFIAETLPQRAPILKCLSHYNEDLSQKAIDYMIKHAESKNESVALVAMETFVDLVRDKPGCIQKQKVRLKNVWKTSNNPTVKQLCATLLPDIKATTNKSEVKKVPSAPSQKDLSKMPPIVNKSTGSPAVNKAAVKPSASEPVRKISTTVPVTSVPARGDVKTAETTPNVKGITNNSELDSYTVGTVISKPVTNNVAVMSEGNQSSATDHVTMVSGSETDHVTMVSNSNQSSATSHVTMVSNSNQSKASDHVTMVSNSNQSSATKHVTMVPGINQSSMSVVENTVIEKEMNTIAKPKSVKKDQTVNVVKVTPVNYIDESHNPNAHQNVQSVDKPTMPSNVQSEYLSGVNENISNDTDRNEKGKEKAECGEEERVNDLTNAEVKDIIERKTRPEFPLCLCYNRHNKLTVGKLGRKLKEAGYENVLQTFAEEDSCNILAGAKVVILCLDGYGTVLEESYWKQVAFLTEKGVVIIYLKTENTGITVTTTTTATTLLNSAHNELASDKGHIRLYCKPGEERLSGTDWSKYKFLEVLMWLNYYGIMPDDSLITDEFRCLWNLKPSMRTSGLPEVFISYDWGKHRQIEPVYSALTKEGFTCWMGAYQLEGTESLYNKIQQGLQCCRVVLACITNGYHVSEVCKRDVIIAHGLDRDIISVLIGDCNWPVLGNVGKILNQCKHVRLDIGMDKVIETECKGMQDLVQMLKQVLSNITIKQDLEDDLEAETDAFVEKDFLPNISENEQNRTGPKYPRKVSKSNSMFEVPVDRKVVSRSGVSRRYSNVEGLVVKRELPHGVYVDEDGYTLKSARSKSCSIL